MKHLHRDMGHFTLLSHKTILITKVRTRNFKVEKQAPSSSMIKMIISNRTSSKTSSTWWDIPQRSTEQNIQVFCEDFWPYSNRIIE